MPKQLMILRHAKSDWNTDAASDFERPLAGRGIKDAPRMGSWMGRHGLQPEYVISSPALRAWQTVVPVCRKLGIAETDIHWDGRAYLADVESLLEVLAECPGGAGSVLLVGHNPGLEELVEHLCGDDAARPADGKLLPTATLARITVPDDWTGLPPDSGSLVGITRPRDLEAEA